MPKEGDISKFMIALRKAKEEAFLQGLYSRHASGSGASKRPNESGSSSAPAQVNPKPGANRKVVIVLDEDEEGSETEKEKDTNKLKSKEVRTREIPEALSPHPKIKTSGQNSTSGTNLREVATTGGDSKSAPESQIKEIELLKRRVEMAESNFSALVGRLQDFRTSLRSEIRTMPDAVDSDGLSNLSAAMETTIDDAALFLRDISDGLKQSRTNWEIRCGTQIVKVKEAGTDASGRHESQMPSKGPVDTKGKGKRKAEDGDDVNGGDEEEALMLKKFRASVIDDWEGWGDEEREKQVNRGHSNGQIVYRPHIAAAPKIPNGQKVSRVRTFHGTGEFFDKPCVRCAATLKRCEKEKNGGACLECKAKKHKCDYSSQLRTKKNREMMDNENDQGFMALER